MKKYSEKILLATESLLKLNPIYNEKRKTHKKRGNNLQKVLVANRGEIAKRFFITLKEEGIHSVAVVTNPDKGQSWYEFANEVVYIGDSFEYTNIDKIISAAIISNANAIYPGYGFLSENPQFVETIEEINQTTENKIIFMGPTSEVMRKVGNKLDARSLAETNNIPLFKGSSSIENISEAENISEEIGYPVILKLNAGGGGKGMTIVDSKESLSNAITSTTQIGNNLYGDSTFYIEKFIQNPVHMEVQIFNGLAIGIRKCAIQRRHQKIIEESGEFFLETGQINEMLDSAEKMAVISGYDKSCGAGTIEFLYDLDSKKFGFLEVNTRLQVEHPVTEESLGIDLARWQILLFDGRENEIPFDLRSSSSRKKLLSSQKYHTFECRIYAEDPDNDFSPSPGKLTELILPTFKNVRCDFGFRKGDTIVPDYDPMIGKLITYGHSRNTAIDKMKSALNELTICGITTNIQLLKHVFENKDFCKGQYSNNFLKSYSKTKNEQDINFVLNCASFTAISEYLKTCFEKGAQCVLSHDIGHELFGTPPFLTITTSFRLTLDETSFILEIIPKSLNIFNVMVEGKCFGTFNVLQTNNKFNKILVQKNSSIYNTKIDKRQNFYLIIANDGDKSTEFKIKMSPIKIEEQSDPIGLTRAPFQSTFVRFEKSILDKNGLPKLNMKIKKGEPILTISAMKMETTICAPMGGKLVYLIEGGNLSKLQLSKTNEGLIIGKPIKEGEKLFIIDNDSKKSLSPNIKDTIDISRKKPILDYQKDDNVTNILFNSNFKEILKTNHDKWMNEILNLLLSYFQGLIPSNSIIVDRLEDFIIKQNEPLSGNINEKEIEKSICKILTLHLNLKKFFSPTLTSNFVLFHELKNFINKNINKEFVPSINFKTSINQLFSFYEITDWIKEIQDQTIKSKTSLYLILRAFHSCLKSASTIASLVKILGNFKILDPKTLQLLEKILYQEEAEIDNAIALEANKTLLKHRNLKKSVRPQLDEKFITLDSKDKLEKSLKTPSSDLSFNNLSPETRKKIEIKIKYLQKKGTLTQIASPSEDILIYSIKDNLSGNHFYFIYYIFDNLKDKDIFISNKILNKLNNIFSILNLLNSIKPTQNSYIEIIFKSTLKFDLYEKFRSTHLWNILNNFSSEVRYFFDNNIIDKLIFDTYFDYKNINNEYKPLVLQKTNNKIELSLLLDSDPTNPYYNKNDEDPKTLLMLSRGKWPVETWVKEVFDSNDFNEIKIESIDNTTHINPKTKTKEIKPVASKIYLGSINQDKACFYFKDSRINGGATGNLEGLKYASAVYISKTMGIPLYVWNDGAGANIKEGMIALNRAAQGFMMNTISTSISDLKKFRDFINTSYDDTLKKLISEIDKNLDFSFENKNFFRNNHMIISVSIGSSSGLDVYGASQSTFQLMLDDVNCYRVLTGSKVINSVTGENLSNYEIGGAPIMSKVTGTVDIVAKNKFELISILKNLHNSIIEKENTENLTTQNNKSLKLFNTELIDESIIMSNVDKESFIPLKNEYYGSSELIGGLAKLGGKRTIIIAPRSSTGIISSSSLIKTKELLKISNKLKCSVIFLFNKNFFSNMISNCEINFRTRYEILNELKKRKGLTISIVSSEESFKETELLGLTDVKIYIKSNDSEKKLPSRLKFINSLVTFYSNSISDAFINLSKMISNLYELEIPSFNPSNKSPNLLSKDSGPFDIIENIIEPISDKDSFLELYKEMNDPEKGPALITGFTRIKGISLALIADQPAILNGAPDAKGLTKFRIFVDLISKFKIPILMLSNAPGFIPGTKQERMRIQQEGGESLDLNILSENHVISVVLNQNYGGRQIHAFSKALRPNITYLALERSILAVMGAQASFDLFHGVNYNKMLSGNKELEAQNLKSEYFENFNNKSLAGNNAKDTSIIDLLVPDIKELRDYIFKTLINLT